MKFLNQFIKESLIKENFGEFKNAQEVATKRNIFYKFRKTKSYF